MPTEVPLAIEFANSRYAVRGHPQEGIGTVADLTAWLRDHLPTFDCPNVDIRTIDSFIELRDAVRAILRACVAGEPPEAESLAAINAAAAAAPRWPVLDASYAVVERASCIGLDAARGAIVRDLMDLVAGPLRADLLACEAPGCVRFFLKDHPRREWCCDSCGNRARAARHYRRHRINPEPS
jgi:predicted RNA-binding Zn ribbon-like protein